MPIVFIHGVTEEHCGDPTKPNFLSENLSKISDDIKKIIKEQINSSAIIHFVPGTENGMLDLGNVTCEIKYDPLLNRDYNKMQAICILIAESIDKHVSKTFNEVAIRVFTTRLDKINEGYYSTSTPKNKLENFVETDKNKDMKVFYSDDDQKRFRLAFLLEQHNQLPTSSEYDEERRQLAIKAGRINKRQ